MFAPQRLFHPGRQGCARELAGLDAARAMASCARSRCSGVRPGCAAMKRLSSEALDRWTGNPCHARIQERRQIALGAGRTRTLQRHAHARARCGATPGARCGATRTLQRHAGARHAHAHAAAPRRAPTLPPRDPSPARPRRTPRRSATRYRAARPPSRAHPYRPRASCPPCASWRGRRPAAGLRVPAAPAATTAVASADPPRLGDDAIQATVHYAFKEVNSVNEPMRSAPTSRFSLGNTENSALKASRTARVGLDRPDPTTKQTIRTTEQSDVSG